LNRSDEDKSVADRVEVTLCGQPAADIFGKAHHHHSCPKGNVMKTIIKLGCPLVLAIALALPAAPAHAQFAGDQMSQFAPMIAMVKKKIGKKRFARLMQTIGPIMTGMMQQGGGFGGFGP
jgi:hypothetical protein